MDKQALVQTQLDRSLSFLKLGDVDQAISAVEEAISYEVSVKDLLFAKGLCLYSSNDLEGAQQALEMELSQFPSNQQAKDFLASLQQERRAPNRENDIPLGSRENSSSTSEPQALMSSFEQLLNENPLAGLQVYQSVLENSASSTLQAIFKLLSSPCGHVPSDQVKLIRQCLVNNSHLFTKLYNTLILSSGSRQASHSDPEHSQLVSDLKRDGIAFWPSFISDPAQLEALQEICRAATVDAKTCIANSDSRIKWVYEPKYNCEVQYNYDQTQGRSRLFFTQQKPPCNQTINSLAHNSVFPQIASAYVDADVTYAYTMFERLEPAEVHDRWHIDTLRDDFKVMILLSDTEQHHGPLRFLKGTKNNLDLLAPVMHATFCHGLDYAYPPPMFIKSQNLEPCYGTGKAGDAILFDVGAIHSGTGCLREHRDCVVLRYTVHNQKNSILTLLQGNAHY